MLLLLVTVLVCVEIGGSSELTPTGERSYELNVPGSSSSIKIIESDFPWVEDNNKIINPSIGDNFNSQALKEFLNFYSEKLRKKEYTGNNDEYKNDEKDIIEVVENNSEKQPTYDKEEKSKHWNLMHLQKHKHPFDDKNGWVSLDPVPWSLSKVSKWHGEKKPVQKPSPPYNAVELPWKLDMELNGYNDVPAKYTWHQTPRPYKIKPMFTLNPSETYHEEETDQTDNYYLTKPNIFRKPEHSKPEPTFDQNIQVHYDTDNSEDATKNTNYMQRPSYSDRYSIHSQPNCLHSSEQIITDGQPANFPTYHHNRRKSSEIPESHPFSGNGNWILLSTTKGFKSPQSRQRSLQAISNSEHPTDSVRLRKGIQNSEQTRAPIDSVGLRKGVQLTVLPPLKSSKINMTTSHGGLLQVESTFETVEQAQQRHAKKLRLKGIRKKPSKLKVVKNFNRVVKKPVVQKLNVALPLSTFNKRISNNPDISTVLAAAGAGMIPATMAMLVPMAMGGKKRRKRHVQFQRLI